MLSDPSGPLQDALAAVIARYDEDDVPDGEKLPERCYIGHGVPGQIADLDPIPLEPDGSLMASMVRLQVTTQPSDGTTSTAVGVQNVHSIVYQLRLQRPVATFGGDGSPPDAVTVTRQSLMLVRDAARLVDALHAWGEALPPWLRVVIGQVEPLGPSGKVAGNRVTATLGPI